MTAGLGMITPVVAERAAGSWIYGKDGKKYLDFQVRLLLHTRHTRKTVSACLLRARACANHPCELRTCETDCVRHFVALYLLFLRISRELASPILVIATLA
jgi:4-aminobutyrate aminotransferase-like enzyme